MRLLILILIPALLLAASMSHADEKPKSDGEALFLARCSGLCHQTPVKNRLNAKQWKVVLVTMQTRIHGSGMAPLTAAETDLIYAYLTDSESP